MSTKYWIINGQAVSDYHVLGYTEYPSNPCSVWNDNGDLIVNSWQASENEPNVASCYWLSDNGSGGTVNRWFADESELESFGFHLTPPVTGFVYGVMDDTQDKDKGAIETGFTGYMELIHGNMINCGVGEYGVIKHATSMTVSLGTVTSIPGEVVSVSSKYWWMYGFNGGSSTQNLWTPNAWATGLLANTDYEWMGNAEFEEARFWNGSSEEDYDFNQWKLRLWTYNGRPEMYSDPSMSVSSSLNSSIVVVPGSSPTWTNRTVFDIPESMYYMSNGKIYWNTSHKLYNLLYGYSVTVNYIP